MEKIKINLRSGVDSTRELSVRRFFVKNESLVFVLNDRINHELSIGQTFKFKRQMYRENGEYLFLDNTVEIIGLSTYLDDDGNEYDLVETSNVPNKRLTIDRRSISYFTYYDFSGGTYFSSSTPTVSILDYVVVDESELDYYMSEAESLPEEEYESYAFKYLSTTGVSENGVEHIDKTYHYVNVIPEESGYFDSPYFSGMTDGETVDEFVQSHPEEFPYFSAMTQGETIEEFMERMPELFEFDEHIERYIVTFNESHNIFYQDIRLTKETPYVTEYDIAVFDIYGNVIGYLKSLSPIHRIDSIELDDDDFYNTTIEETCGMYDEAGYPYDVSFHNYFFIPNNLSDNKIAITGAETNRVARTLTDTDRTYRNRQIEYLLENGFYFEPRYNPFFYKYYDGNDNCGVFWGDVLWDFYNHANNDTPRKDVWVNCGMTKSVLTIDESYYRVPINALVDVSNSLGVDDDLSRFANNEINTLIPQTIDYERVKYIPIDGHNSGELKTQIYFINKITLDLHFRKRKETPNSTEEWPKYENGWYIDPDSASTTWWNEMNYNGAEFNANAMNVFMDEQDGKSDLLGYLGFDDDDVYNQKRKIRDTFVRLSFYTSKDPIEQKLLYYSTVFFDSGSLFGKYMKQKIHNYETHTNPSGPLVFHCGDNRLDSKITITNEYDKTTSAEGFNLYLFRDDVQETGFRTIYMKVEFNHAGYGKTIPMVLWPVDEDDNFIPLTLDNYLDSLYIPVILQYINGKYTYLIDGAKINGDEIKLVLFEPKLELDIVDTEANNNGIDDQTEPNDHF
jgi:hypothetical protein